MKIDYRSLLTRYINTSPNEGTNFICRIGERARVKFTDEEVAELKALEKDEGQARWNQKR